MNSPRTALRKSHRGLARPDFDQIVLVLQGGGALGSYQSGVYQALEEANLEVDWIVGVSIGAINAALIAGTPPGNRIAKLRTFWDEVASQPWCTAWLAALPADVIGSRAIRAWLGHLSAVSAAAAGVRSMFSPRLLPAWLWPTGCDGAISLYDATPLKESLSRYVDFDRINAGSMRFSVGAVNIRTGNFGYFDTASHDIRLEHVLASAALPPMFAPVEVDGEFYWDGGVVSNTPLQWAVEAEPHRDSLVFQVDVWNTRGDYPSDLAETMTRQNEIQYASRTRAGSNAFRQMQRLKNTVSLALAELPSDVSDLPTIQRLHKQVDRKLFRIVQLIYHARPHLGATKDFAFSASNINEHWDTGYHDAVRTLRHPEALTRPELEVAEGVATFDVAIDGRL
ncbi:patatin-like phospholipase family protein [Bosea psychrotolerans]|uniref:NTE family protein n=1 Tax=Bosea psychrotolerans TaxID=1871628 RepID=A0A2S4MQK7_9HYPH|nr:patatin-like phospholipase family protein [Bosea psychrotolerans]POR57068.1 NTE family protein [Bosea psychrotolerans]